MTQQPSQPDDAFLHESLRLPSQLGQPRHKPSLIGRIGEQVRLLWGPKRLFLGLAIAWLSVGGGRFLLSQIGQTQIGKTQNADQTTDGTSSAETARNLAATGEESLQSVTLETARLATVEDVVTLTGTVMPREMVQVAPSLSGLRILEMRAEVGDRIEAGQPLAVLDSSVLRAALAQAEANLTQAQAKIAQLEAKLTQADIRRQAASVDISRYSALYQQGAISQEQLGDRQIRAAATQEGIAVITADIDSAHADIASKIAEIERIEAQLAQTVVVSPVSGIIAQKLTTIGNAASGPLYSIIENGQMDLVVKPSQTQFAEIEVGTPALISPANSNSTRLRGSVYAIEPTLDAQNRQATVKIALPASELSTSPDVKPGMFLQADLITQRRRSVVVPAKAVVAQPDGSAVVYTLDTADAKPADPDKTGAEQVQSNPVQVAQVANTSDQVEILSGLDAGSRVVVGGVNYIQDGDAVTTASGTASSFASSSSPASR